MILALGTRADDSRVIMVFSGVIFIYLFIYLFIYYEKSYISYIYITTFGPSLFINHSFTLFCPWSSFPCSVLTIVRILSGRMQQASHGVQM